MRRGRGVPLRSDGRDGAAVVGARAGAARAAAGAPVAARPAVPAGGRAAESSSGLRGASEELRNRLRTQRRLRVVTLLSLAVVVLVVLPAVFGLRHRCQGPGVQLAGRARGARLGGHEASHDQGSGSRWCFLELPVPGAGRPSRRSRSRRPPRPTRRRWPRPAGSRGRSASARRQPIAADEGTYSCWKRDEFTLDLWVRQPNCARRSGRRAGSGGGRRLTSAPATPDPARTVSGPP